MHYISLHKEIFGKIYSDEYIIDKFCVYDDRFMVKKMLQHYALIKQYAISNSNYDLCDVILDIDFAIEKAELSQTEIKNIELWKKGFTEYEIAEEICYSQNGVHVSLSTACEKISKRLTKRSIGVFKN